MARIVYPATNAMAKINTAQSRIERSARRVFGMNCGLIGSIGSASSLIRFFRQRRLTRTIWRR